jgi:hypothetical protein
LPAMVVHCGTLSDSSPIGKDNPPPGLPSPWSVPTYLSRSGKSQSSIQLPDIMLLYQRLFFN